MSKFTTACDAFDTFLGFRGNDPTTKAEYDAFLVNKDSFMIDKKAVFSGTPHTWEEIQAKIKEIDDAAAKAKVDKVSAYRKLSMTDDEINALDPTLLEE